MRTAVSEWDLWSTHARLVVADPSRLDAARAIADDELAAVEAACSRFRDDSELVRLSPELPRGVVVSPLLARLVGAALDAAAATDGDVDPTLGAALDRAGYDRDIRLIEDADTILRAVVAPRSGWRGVTLTADRVLTVPEPWRLDLGATAKALAADAAATRIADELGAGVLLSLGGDIAVAGPEPERPWRVLVQDLPTDPATTVHLATGHGMATSSTQKRVWRRGGRLVHHILDPRTGLPAAPVWRSVTVADRSCLAANTLSTAAVVRGDRAVPWLRALRADARLVAADGTVVTTGAWPSERSAA